MTMAIPFVGRILKTAVLTVVITWLTTTLISAGVQFHETYVEYSQKKLSSNWFQDSVCTNPEAIRRGALLIREFCERAYVYSTAIPFMHAFAAAGECILFHCWNLLSTTAVQILFVVWFARLFVLRTIIARIPRPPAPHFALPYPYRKRQYRQLRLHG